jgi:hypothetical protein
MTDSFFEQLDTVKGVLAAPLPVRDKFAAIRPLLADQDVLREFWNLLGDESWIEVLREAGVFETPPAAEPVDGGGVRFPPWPASKYLARMASRAPRQVADILAGIDTQNLSIIGDIVEAALAIPLEQATKLVPAIERAARRGGLWIHFKDTSDFCAKLAAEGRPDLALSLADVLFAPTTEDGAQRQSSRDVYWYKEGLEQIIPNLSACSPQLFLPMLCGWLDVLVRSTKSVDPTTGNDYSYIWRPAIEEHEQNRSHDLPGIVVGCVRAGFEQAIRAGGVSLTRALREIDARGLLVFRRIVLHLLAEFGDQDRERVTLTILNRVYFDDHALKHEYSRLVAQQLSGISEADRERWYGWVDDGPDMSGFDEDVRRHLHRDPTARDRQARVDYWKLERLYWVHDILHGQRRQLYEKLLAEHGTPEMADLSFRVSTRWGSESPATVDQLTAMNFEAAVDWVVAWRPPADSPFGATSSGLMSTFGGYVSKNPETFARKAASLKEKPAAVISVFVSQMAAAIRAGREIELPSLLELCEWVTTNPADDTWQPVRDEISELIQAVCQAGERTPLFPVARYREGLWSLIRQLYRDRAQSYVVRDTSKDDFRLHDYLDLGINSPRGKAVGAALDFGRWVALELTRDRPSHERVPGGFGAISELREALEWQLMPPNRSLEALAVIGGRLGLIHWIDDAWLAKNTAVLFDLAGIEQGRDNGFGWAAWNAFLVWVRPHVLFYRLFEREFAYAVRQAALVHPEKQDDFQPMFRLGEHLMVIYGRGELSLSEPVLQEFLLTADSAVRRHALGFVGSSLSQESGVPSPVVTRFVELWEAYWNGRGKDDAKEDPQAVLFGSWLGSKELPQQWVLDTLYEFVQVVPLPQPDHVAMDQLARLAPLDLLKAVRILDRFITGDREGWHIHGWQDPATGILKAALAAGGSAQTAAREVIARFGRRGYTRMGELLRT